MKEIAHYQILEALGSGGMGSVYRARDTKLDRDVALKLLPPDVASDPERRARLLREAKSVAALQHQNIVTVYSVDEADANLFLTMELIEGQTLDAVIPTHGFRINQLLELAVPMADAIAYAHSRGITHRDLKPLNVMVDDRKRVRILDFGLAKLLEEPAPDDDAATVAADPHATAEGVVMGTAAYMSPEQAQGLAVDHRSDIFSLGILLYEMATGRRPFQGDNRMSTISAVIKDTPQPITEINAGLPRQLGRIVHKCLAKDPDQRYQSAQDLHIDLQGLKQETDSGLTEEHTAAVIPALRKRPPFAVMAVLVLAGTLAGWYAYSQRNQQPEGFPVSVDMQPPRPVTPLGLAASPLDQRTMIAVLPFKNLGATEDNYFAAGMTEELISRLAGIKAFGVISSKSAARYADTEMSMQEIGRDLGVHYVVDGSIRYQPGASGSRQIRITPHLIRVEDDVHLWSERYDGMDTELFDLQTRIAENVVEQLNVALGTDDLRIASKVASTSNPEAQRLYLQAKSLVTSFVLADTDRKAINLLERAVELDPDFAAAWSLLSKRLSNQGLYSSISEEQLARARRAAERAMQLDPVQGHLAMGYYYYWGRKQYQRAYAEFEKTGQLDSNPEVMEAAAFVLRRTDRWDESLTLLEAARVLDPKSGWNELADSYKWMRRYDDSERARTKHLQLNPQDRVGPMVLAWEKSSWRGTFDPLRKYLEDTTTLEHPLIFYAQHVIAMWDEDYEASLEIARSLLPVLDFPGIYATRLRAEYQAMKLLGRPEAASHRDEMLLEYKTAVEESPRDYNRRLGYALALAMADDREAAIRQAQTAVDLCPLSADALNGREVLLRQAMVLIYAGEIEQGVQVLRERLADPIGGFPPAQLQIEWILRERADHPAIQALLKPTP